MKNLILIHLESVSELILKTNADLFPNINKIIQESTYYKNYYSSATSTLMVMSDLCYGGMYREKCTKLENNFNDMGGHRSLFDELKDRTYSVKGIIWPRITTYSKIINGHILGKDVEVEAAKSYRDFIECIDESIKSEEPFALFIANFASHVSYRDAEEIKGSHAFARWKEGYRQIDDTCGKVLEMLRKNGKNDTVIVFYGDHGDDYWGHRLHNGYTHAIEPYSSIIHVPLIIWDAAEKKGIEHKLVSSLDIKKKILSILFDTLFESNRKYIVSRNIYANQKVDVMSLSKGYAVATEEYILLVSIRGLELYNTKMDPANTCNLLEFFDIDGKDNIKFSPSLKNIKSMHFHDFFTDGEIRHLKQIYKQLRKYLLHETEKIYKFAEKDIEDRNRELKFMKINKSHFFSMYNKGFTEKIEKWFRR